MKELNFLLRNKKSLYITLILSLIYIIPLLISNYEYLDDWGRNLYGYGWQHDGRFIATLFGKLWSFNEAIFSIHPFSLILSALILGFTGYLITSIFNIEKENTIKWSSLIVLTNPVFLGNLVFKFDSLPMALSLFFVVFPFVYYEKKWWFIFTSLIGVFLSLGLYQNSATVFFIVGSFFLIQDVKNWEWKSFIVNLGFIIGIFLTAFVGYISIIKIMGFSSERTEMIVFQTDFILNLMNNYEIFKQRIDLILGSGNYILFVGSFLFFCVLGVAYYIFFNKNKFKLFVILPVILLIVLVDYVLISSVNILLKETYWDLRTFCGLSFFLLICLSFQNELKGIGLKIGRQFTFLLIAFSFVLMAQFGRILDYQFQFQNAISYELNHYFKDETIKKVSFIGMLRIAPRNEFVYSKFPLFNNLLSSPIGQFSAWTNDALNANGMLEGVEVISVDQVDCKTPLIEKTRFYYVRKINDDTLMIDFNRNQCN